MSSTQKTKRIVVIETVTESFEIDVPADLDGEELDEYVEYERANVNHARRCDGVIAVDWWEK